MIPKLKITWTCEDCGFNQDSNREAVVMPTSPTGAPDRVFCKQCHTRRCENLYGCYQTGWRDGAAGRAKRPNFTQHDKHDFVHAYECGYTGGAVAYSNAMRGASDVYTHKPSILRGDP